MSTRDCAACVCQEPAEPFSRAGASSRELVYRFKVVFAEVSLGATVEPYSNHVLVGEFNALIVFKLTFEFVY